MPHIVVKMFEGRPEEKKQELAAKLAEAMMSVLGNTEASISIAIEEFPRDQWQDEVFVPQIKGRKETLYKKPGYASVDD